MTARPAGLNEDHGHVVVAFDDNRFEETGGAVWKIVASNQIPEGAELAPVE